MQEPACRDGWGWKRARPRKGGSLLFAKVLCGRDGSCGIFAVHSFYSCPFVICLPIHLVTGRPHSIALHFIVLHRYCFFYRLKACGNLAWTTPSTPFFCKSICSFPISVSHFGSSHHISNFFMIIISIIVISDL